MDSHVAYNPPTEKLLEHCKPVDDSFSWGANSTELPFNHDLFEEIKDLSVTKNLPTNSEMVSAFYWLVTKYISSYTTHVGLQSISNLHLEENKKVLEAIELIEDAEAGKGKFTILLRGGGSSVAVDDPGLINQVKNYLLAQKARIPETENIQKSDFKNQPYYEGAKAVEGFLIAESIENLRTRAKIIGYLYSLAGIPFRGTVEVAGKLRKVPLSHRSLEFDEESMIKSVLYYL